MSNEVEERLTRRSVYDYLAPRCTACNKMFAIGLSRPYWIRCDRCGADNIVD